MDKSKAKKNMLASLSKEMRDMMGEGYSKGLSDKMMKVTVAGDDKESVEKGLDKAKEILKKKLGEDMLPMDRSPAELEDLEEAEEMEESEDEMEESKEELEAKIEELKKKLASKE